MNKPSIFFSSYCKKMGYYVTQSKYNYSSQINNYTIRNKNNDRTYKHITIHAHINNIYKYIQYPIYQRR